MVSTVRLRGVDRMRHEPAALGPCGGLVFYGGEGGHLRGLRWLVRSFSAVGTTGSADKPFVNLVLIPPDRIWPEDDWRRKLAISNVAPNFDATPADLSCEGFVAADNSATRHANLHETRRDYHGVSWRLSRIADVKRHTP